MLFVVFGAVAFTTLYAGGASAQVCQEFDVGSAEWQQCVQDAAGGGGGGGDDTQGGGGSQGGDKKKSGGKQGGGKQGGGEQETTGNEAACSEFTVGSKQWNDCIKDAATGGGLMPWIVIIPLGVMLLGMAVMFTLQARRNARFESFSSASIGSTAGIWLIFVAFIELAIGIGMAVGESRADGSSGGFGMASYILIGTGVILLLAGIITTVKARRKRKIETTGQSGTAKIMRISQTSTYINENPVFMFDLEIDVPGLAPYRTTARATVPMYMVQKMTPGSTVPVKVDPARQNDVVIDWSSATAVPAEATATSSTPTS